MGLEAAIVTGVTTGIKGLRVYGGPTDPISDIPVGIDFGHHQVHEGEAHTAQSVQLSLAATTVKFAVTVPAGIYPHMVFDTDVYNGTTLVQVYEGATFTGGSDVTSYNRNRNSVIAPGTTIKSGVTSTNGTLIHSSYVGAGSKAAVSDRAGSELLLKANTVYRVDVIGQAAGTAAIVVFDWYEDLGV